MDPASISPETRTAEQFVQSSRTLSPAPLLKQKSGMLPRKGNQLPHQVDSFTSSENAQITKVSETAPRNIPKLQKNETYVDQHRLLKAKRGGDGDLDVRIKEVHEHWNLHQATTLPYAEKTNSPRTRENIELVAIHGYSKAATVGREESTDYGIQTTPFMPEEQRYHRSAKNALRGAVNRAFEMNMGISEDGMRNEVMLVDSFLVKEVLNREFPAAGLNLNIKNTKEFENLLDQLLQQAKSGKFPEGHLFIDFSALLKGKTPAESQKIAKEFEQIVAVIVTAKFGNDTKKLDQVAEKLLFHMDLIGFTTHKEQNVMLVPRFLANPTFLTTDSRQKMNEKRGVVIGDLVALMSHNGFHLSPDQAKKAWLKVEDARTILTDRNLPLVELATEGGQVGEVCKSCQAFISQPIVGKFRSLSQEGIPYLKVLPEATARLLEGLAKHDIDQFFEKKGIKEMLQISYFRMLNSMSEAIHHKEDPIAFMNQIELIHQEIQKVLTIVEPYDDQALAEGVRKKLSPVIPGELEAPQVHLKAGAMRGVASVLAGAEKQKGGLSLNVAVLKDSYYETAGNMKTAKTHQTTLLDGDAFNTSHQLPSFPNAPIDLFVCEFHHNISADRQVYRPENVTAQVEAMLNTPGVTADKFTVMIDTTINLENSDDVRQFFSNPTIKNAIDQGRLNVVLLRSAQKFDMLGMDNYYGGITVSVNNSKAFGAFNDRMNDKDDQLRGLSYQGIAHLQKNGGEYLDNYRKEIMKNTHLLYDMLPKKAIFTEGTNNLMQISRVEDEKTVFLDIKFPSCEKAIDAFSKRLKQFAHEEGLPFTERSSFGFVNTNYTVIGECKMVRLNPGLEDKKTMERYAAFLGSVQKTVEEVMKSTKNKSNAEIDAKLSEKIEGLKMKS